MKTIVDMARNKRVEGMHIDLSKSPCTCKHCILGKQGKSTVPKVRKGPRSTVPLEKVFMDLMGPMAVKSAGGAAYLLDLVDDCSSHPWSIPIANKSDTLPALRKWEAERFAETGKHVSIFIADNGGEFKSENVTEWCNSLGIEQKFSAPYTSAHIGKAERMHRTIMGHSRAMRSYAKLPPNMWAECVTTATYLIARTPTSSLDGRTPYEGFHGKKPDISHLREFGAKAFVLIQNRHNSKIYERSIECVMIGYSNNSKAYRLYHRTSGTIYTSYHVAFIESHEEMTKDLFPGLIIGEPDNKKTTNGTPEPTKVEDENDETNHTPVEDESSGNQIPDPSVDEPRRSGRVRTKTTPGTEPTARLEKTMSEVKAAAERKTTKKDRRAERVNSQERELQREIFDGALPELTPEPEDTEEMIQALSTEYLATDTEADENFIEIPDHIAHELLAYSALAPDEPDTLSEALNGPEAAKWCASLEEEFDGIRKMGVFKLVPRDSVPKGRKILKGRPVFKKKHDETGAVTRFKARWVVKGFAAVYGQDYTKTTSPTARLESIRAILHIGAARDWAIQQIDIKQAYLNGLLPVEEKCWMEQPKGFEEPGKENWLWEMLKALYGMKQAGRTWNKTMDGKMISWGFRAVDVERCLYYRSDAHGEILTAVHVDDFAITTSSPNLINNFKSQISTAWKFSDLGEASFIVGIQITRDRAARTISLSQTALIDSVVSQFRQENAHPASTPLTAGSKLRKSDCPMTEEGRADMAKYPYRQLVGSLMYIAIGTRPDISQAVRSLSQFLDNPGRRHYEAGIRVIQYLKGTRNTSLTLGGTSPIRLGGATDSDYANCEDTRRSVSGYTFTLGSGLISWSSRKQTTTATSTCEAEYIAACHSTKEAVWLRALLKEINIEQIGPTQIDCDNQGTIVLTEDPSFHARTKHFDVQYHYTCERVDTGDITFKYIPSAENIADAFTKNLDVKAFQKFRGRMGLNDSQL